MSFPAGMRIMAAVNVALETYVSQTMHNTHSKLCCDVVFLTLRSFYYHVVLFCMSYLPSPKKPVQSQGNNVIAMVE